MHRFILDAETDGLYGKVLTVAVLVADEDGKVIEEFYGGIPHSLAAVTNDWVKENVLPKVGSYQAFDSEEALLEACWSLWLSYRKVAYCFSDVAVPVEASLWRKMVLAQPEERVSLAPFPLIDLASVLYSKGYNPLIARLDLVPDFSGQVHNALDDVRLTNAVLTRIL